LKLLAYCGNDWFDVLCLVVGGQNQPDGIGHGGQPTPSRPGCAV